MCDLVGAITSPAPFALVVRTVADDLETASAARHTPDCSNAGKLILGICTNIYFRFSM